MAKTNSNVRMRGSDYQKEFIDLILSKESFEKKVRARLLELCKQHPDAIVATIVGDVNIKAKSITMAYLDRIETIVVIGYIISIEKWLEDQSPVKQGKLFK